jgi:uncharacterized protein YukE
VVYNDILTCMMQSNTLLNSLESAVDRYESVRDNATSTGAFSNDARDAIDDVLKNLNALAERAGDSQSEDEFLDITLDIEELAEIYSDEAEHLRKKKRDVRRRYESSAEQIYDSAAADLRKILQDLTA